MENQDTNILDPTTSPVQTQNPPAKSNPWIMVGIGGIILALGIVIGVFAYQNLRPQQRNVSLQTQSTPTPSSTPAYTPTPTPDPTANWKIYTDDKLGVEFRYPQTWYAKQLAEWQFNVFLDNHPFDIPTAAEFLTPIQIYLNEAQNTVTNKKFFQEKKLEDGIKRISNLFDQSSSTIKNRTVDGKKAVLLSGINAPGMLGGQFYSTTLIQLDNKLLLISLHDQKFQTTYDQILSTFKFTSGLTPTLIIINDTYHCKDGSIMETSDKCSPPE